MPSRSTNRTSNSRLNALRAAVLGANDGIVSTAGLVVGVAGANSSHEAILTAGIAGVVAGAISMAAGEYVSVSSQRDSQKALIQQEKQELRDFPEEEFDELVQLYRHKGLSLDTATLVARELSKKDPFAAHADIELHIHPNDLTNPWQAAFASALSFSIGSLVPLAAIVFSSNESRIALTAISVVISLAATGFLSAKAGGANKARASLRVISWGIGAMVATYTIGLLVGTAM